MSKRADEIWRLFTRYQFDSYVFDTGRMNVAALRDERFCARASFAEDLPVVGLEDGHVPNLQYGEYLSDVDASKLKNPIIISCLRPEKDPANIRYFPDIISDWQPVISSRLRAIIEKFEPGIHQFFPVRFESSRDGSEIFTDREYFY